MHLINFLISDTAIGQPHLAGKDFCSWLLYFKSYCVVLHLLLQCHLWCYGGSFWGMSVVVANATLYMPLTTDRDLDPTTLVDWDLFNPVTTIVGSITEKPLQLKGPRRGLCGRVS